MYPSLNSALNWKDFSSLPEGYSICISDTTKCDGSILLPHFISMALRSTRPTSVVFCSFSQVYSNLLQIMKKLGLDLSSYRNNGSFLFVDGFTRLFDQNPHGNFQVSQTLNNPALHGNDSLCFQIQNILEKMPFNDRVCLIVDDISVLDAMGFEKAQIMNFLLYLQEYCQKSNGVIIILNHDTNNFYGKWMRHNSHLSIAFSELSSGFCKEIDGYVEISPAGLCTNENTNPITLHYKAFDNAVNFFPKGLSRYVL